MGEKIKRLTRLIWREYNYQMILVLATLTSLIIEASSAEHYSHYRLIPIGLLIACLAYFIWNGVDILNSIHPSPQLPYSVCIGKKHDWFQSTALKQQEARLKDSSIRWKDVQRIFRIHLTDWAFIYTSTLNTTDEWLSVTRRLFDHFWQLHKRIDEGNPTHHFFFVAPPSITFAFGAYIGRKVAHVAYHHVGNVSKPYLEITNTSRRDTSAGLDLLNVRVKEYDFSHIGVTREQLDGEGPVIISLDFTNHRTSPPYLNQDLASELVRVTHINGIGHLPKTEWDMVAREIASLILEYSDKGLCVDVYINTPISLAFTIGSIVGPMHGIGLCEHNPYLQKLIRCFDLADSKLQVIQASDN